MTSKSVALVILVLLAPVLALADQTLPRVSSSCSGSPPRLTCTYSNGSCTRSGAAIGTTWMHCTSTSSMQGTDPNNPECTTSIRCLASITANDTCTSNSSTVQLTTTYVKPGGGGPGGCSPIVCG